MSFEKAFIVSGAGDSFSHEAEMVSDGGGEDAVGVPAATITTSQDRVDLSADSGPLARDQQGGGGEMVSCLWVGRWGLCQWSLTGSTDLFPARANNAQVAQADEPDTESTGWSKGVVVRELENGPPAWSVGCFVDRESSLALSGAESQPGRNPMLEAYGPVVEGIHTPLDAVSEMRTRIRDLQRELEELRALSGPVNDNFFELEEEMRLAAKLQRDFLPRELPQLPGLRFGAVFRPMMWVSGDIYDVMRLDEEHVGFYVADVMGHGMPAALLTLFIKRSLVPKHISNGQYTLVPPGEVMRRLNDDLVAQEMSNYQFATCCYGLLNTKTHQLRLANAGHPRPLLIGQDASICEVDASGTLLGVFPQQQYHEVTVTLGAGEKLLLYSDGLELAFAGDSPGELLWTRLGFRQVAQYPIDAMCRCVGDVLNKEQGSLHPRDDVTLVGLERLPQTT